MPSIEPKPFAYVSTAPEPPKRTSYVSHNTISQGSLTGRLWLELEATSDYLFVGSGSYDFIGNTVYYSFARSGGQITIQGTSIKGAVRSVLEAISNSCVSQYSRRDGELPRAHNSCDSIGKLCPACRIFGRTTGDGSYAGRVSFSDASPIQLNGPEIVKISELFRPQRPSSRRKFYQDKRASAISDKRPERNMRLLEALRRGSRLKLHADFHNLAPEELSLLLFSLGINQNYFIKVGGAKPRGFGSVIIRPLSIELHALPFGDSEHIEGANLEKYLNDIMGKRTLLHEALLRQYIEETMKNRGQTAPRGVY